MRAIHSQNPIRITMTRILTTLAAAAFTFAIASCCCTSDTEPVGLRSLPSFQEIPQATAPPEHTPAPIRATK